MTDQPVTCDRTWPADHIRDDVYTQHHCEQAGDHACQCRYCGAVRPAGRWGR